MGLLICTLALPLLFFASCGSSSSGGGGGGGGVASMSEVIPTDVVLSSPTAARAGAGGMIVASGKGIGLKAATDDYETKREEVEALASGEHECTFTAVSPAQDLSFANCYGPNVEYTNHLENNLPTGNGTFGGGDLGIWNGTNLNNPDEACAAAQLNNAVSFAASYVDNVMGILGAIACAGVKGGKTPPEVGDSVDLSSDISEFVTITGFTFTSAVIERLPDDGTHPVYQLTIGGTVSAVDGVEHGFDVIVKHEPTATDNSTYKGKISYKYVTQTTTKPGNCEIDFSDVVSPGGVRGGVIAYEKASATDLKYEMNTVEFCGADSNPFDSNNDIDPTNVVSDLNPDGWANGYHYGLFNINPDEGGTGRSAYAWAAGYGGEGARTLNVSITQAADGNASGDAYFGFGPSIQGATDTTRGSIINMQCNWGSGVTQPLVQHQGLTRAAGETVFGSVEDVENITFAPKNTCSYEGGAFTYWNTTGIVMDNDNNDGHPVPNDLLPLEDYQTGFTMPTAPSTI